MGNGQIKAVPIVAIFEIWNDTFLKVNKLYEARKMRVLGPSLDTGGPSWSFYVCAVFSGWTTRMIAGFWLPIFDFSSIVGWSIHNTRVFLISCHSWVSWHAEHALHQEFDGWRLHISSYFQIFPMKKDITLGHTLFSDPGRRSLILLLSQAPHETTWPSAHRAATEPWLLLFECWRGKQLA